MKIKSICRNIYIFRLNHSKMMFHIFGNLLYSISLRFHKVTTLVSEEDIPVSLTDIEQAVAWHGGCRWLKNMRQRNLYSRSICARKNPGMGRKFRLMFNNKKSIFMLKVKKLFISKPLYFFTRINLIRYAKNGCFLHWVICYFYKNQTHDPVFSSFYQSCNWQIIELCNLGVGCFAKLSYANWRSKINQVLNKKNYNREQNLSF